MSKQKLIIHRRIANVHFMVRDETVNHINKYS